MDFPPICLWKRARSAKPKKPKSLRGLAMDAFINELQNKLVVDVSKIPKEFGDDIWRNMSTCKIIRTALNSNAVEWFSENVIDKPRWISVRFLGNLGSVVLEFPQRETFLWKFAKPSKNNKNKPDNDHFNIMIGDHVLKTRLHRFASQNRYNTNSIVSVLPSEDFNVRYDIVQWLFKFFQCKVRTFEFENSEFCKYWNFLEEPDAVKIERCTDLDFVERVLPERQRKNWTTIISELDLHEPCIISPELFSRIHYKRYHLNLTTSSFQEVLQLYQDAIDLKVEYLFTKVSDWSPQALESLKEILKLSDYSEELEPMNRFSTMRDKRVYDLKTHRKYQRIFEDGSKVLISVFEKENAIDGLGAMYIAKLEAEANQRKVHKRLCDQCKSKCQNEQFHQLLSSKILY